MNDASDIRSAALQSRAWPYEEARKLGLTPDKGVTIPSKPTGTLKKK